MKSKRMFRIPILAITALTLCVLASGPAFADDAEDGSIQKIVIGVQGASVEGDETGDNDDDSDSDDRDGRFDRYQDVPNGFVIDYLRFAQTFADGQNYADFTAVDPLQDDERYRVRVGLGNRTRMRYSFTSTPMVFGNNARTVLGRESAGVLRIADFIQQQLEDPDGNGVPFYLEPLGVGGDNLLAQGLANDLLTGAQPFDLELKRRTSDFGVSYGPSSKWTAGFDYQRHVSRGTQPLGSGSYQRITDVNGDGATDCRSPNSL